MADSFYSPKAALYDAYPKMKELSKLANAVMEGAEETLAERELAGCDTSYARDRHADAEWRIGNTGDHVKAADAVERLKAALTCVDPPDGLTQDCGEALPPAPMSSF